MRLKTEVCVCVLLSRCVSSCYVDVRVCMCVSSDVALAAVTVADSRFKSRTGGRVRRRGRKRGILKVQKVRGGQEISQEMGGGQ